MSTAVSASLGDREFRKICQIVREHARIELGESKRQLCQTRLIRRLRALELGSFAQYVALLDDPDELTEMINAITTNVTAFFRENHHFEALAHDILPALAKQKRVRIWSAGCSSGEEPWSVAMVLCEALHDHPDAKILATDIDTNILAKAKAGVYSDEAIAPVSTARRAKFMARGTGPNAGLWRAGDELRARVTFKQLNLFDPWPMTGPFDVILCRNVIIYFDNPNKSKLLERYRDLLAPGGHLLLGHSESITSGVAGFGPVGRTMYVKT